MIRFQGGWHFLSGGIAGIQYLTTSTDDDLNKAVSDLHNLGMKPDSPVADEMIQLQPGNECDGFGHYIILTKTWKENVVGREVRDGEYQYWNAANWQGEIERYDSVRDWVAWCVEEAEGMVDRGEVVDPDDSDADDSENDEDEDEDDEPGSEQSGERDGVSEAVEKESSMSEDDWVKVEDQ